MKGFIEITVKYDNAKLTLPVVGIKTILQRSDGNAFIEFESVCCTDKPKDRISLIDTAESYEEVCRKIEEAGAAR